MSGEFVRMRDEGIYDLVVERWWPIVEVAEKFRIGAPGVRAIVQRVFARKHAGALSRMREAMPEREVDNWVPYLWMIRAYERWRVIPNCTPCRESWSRISDPDTLLAEWRRAYRESRAD